MGFAMVHLDGDWIRHAVQCPRTMSTVESGENSVESDEHWAAWLAVCDSHCEFSMWIPHRGELIGFLAGIGEMNANSVTLYADFAAASDELWQCFVCKVANSEEWI